MRLPRLTVARLAVVAALTAAALVPGAALTAATASPSSGGHGLPRVDLPAGQQPEGITSGPGSTFYVGSLADGHILRGDLRTGRSRVLVPGVTGRTTVGMYLDERSGLLWAAGQENGAGQVLAVDAASGRVVATVPVPGAGFLNDLVATRDAVWVTDSFLDRLARIPLDHRGRPAGPAVTFPLPAPWPATQPNTFGGNGIRALDDGSLVLNNSTAGGLWRFLPRSGSVVPVAVTGSIVSGDGLDLAGHTLYNVRGDGGNSVQVVRLREHHGAWSATVLGSLTSPDLDVPSTATVAIGRVWAVNARFGVADPTTAAYWVTRLPLRP